MAEMSITEKCYLCDSEENVEYYCVNCEEILCTACKVCHTKSKKTMGDTVVALSEAKRDGILKKPIVVYCQVHPTEEVSLFCLQCDCLMCKQCLASHSGHNITTPDEVREVKEAELRLNIEALKERKSKYENAFQNQTQAYHEFINSIEQVKKEISDQKAKIIEELNSVCDEQFSELWELKQNEIKRHIDSCNAIQRQNNSVTAAIENTQNCLASNDADLAEQAIMSTTRTMQELEDPSMPPSSLAIYQPGDTSGPNIRHIQGNINIIQKEQN